MFSHRQTGVESRITRAGAFLFAIFLSSVKIGYSQETKLGSLNIGYASATPRAAALWIAKENKIFEKHGLEVNLVAIRGSATTMQALVGGDIDLVYVTGAAAVAAAGEEHRSSLSLHRDIMIIKSWRTPLLPRSSN